MDDFTKNKNQVITNLEILNDNLDALEKMGFEDLDETIHNELFDLIDEVRVVDDTLGLSLIITKAKAIESKLENWEEYQGFSDFELRWPNI